MKFTLLLSLSVLASAQIDFQIIDAAGAPKKVVNVPTGMGAISTLAKIDQSKSRLSEIKQSEIEVCKTRIPRPGSKGPRSYPIERRIVSNSTISTNYTCTPLPAGSGPVPTPDTANAFLNSPVLSSIAAAVPAPSGYTNVFTNLQASSSAWGYLGFTALTSYNTATCAAHCDSTKGCISFNIFFERDPSCVPTVWCPSPPSTNVIKCVLWGSPVSVTNTQNAGQYQQKFQVVIAGSNGYVISSMAPVSGYLPTHDLGKAAINPVTDCNGANTYITSSFFNDGAPFSPVRCAQACTQTSAYSLAQGSKMTCQFFNTYMLYKNGVAQGQFCAQFTQFLPDRFATNVGQTRGSDVYTIGYSFSYTNATNPGVPSNCKLPGQEKNF